MMAGLQFWYSISGKMRDNVWGSPLVRWLRGRNELDLLPWREFILLRVCDLSDNGYPKPSLPSDFDRLGMKSEFSSAGKILVLPTEPEDGGGVFCHRVVPFNFHTWKDNIPYFEPLDEDASTMSDQELDPILAEVDRDEWYYKPQRHNKRASLWRSLASWALKNSSQPTSTISRLQIPGLKSPGVYGISSADRCIVQAANAVVSVFVDL
eukprot:TRINITY_DN11519_c0_g1_i1.p1 TRINITY_DN11519_c0_g1~~TRINITY_DN11519_c0_g1_i1.p1  ORF type:complete len:209 (+),score=22.82 TRINITY_DN11519_c0_g1_i1:363-989(+)